MVERILTRALAFCFVFTSFTLHAEMTKDLSIATSYDNNAFGDAVGQADYITQLGGTLSWWDWGERFETQLYVNSQGYLFAQSNERNFAVSNSGIAFARQLGLGSNRLYAGSSLSLRMGRSGYEIYDFVGMKNYLTFKWYVRPSLMLRTGYTMRFRSYHKQEISRYEDHYLFAQINQFFPTRTTVRGDMSFGYKRHGASEGQLVLGIQVAQSLTNDTGLSLRYQNRQNPIEDSAQDLFSDEDILNDRYDYSGHEWSARLTQQLPMRMRLVAEGGYEIRNYQTITTQAALGAILLSDDFRIDRTTFGSLVLEKPLGDRINTQLIYRFERNLSTDTYYDYNSRHNLSVNFEIGF